MNNTKDDEIAADLRVVISRLVKILRSEIPNDELLSLTERSTLGMIYQCAEILPSELAAKEKVTAQSISQILNKLLECGYIKKKSSKTDKRKALITITAAGKKIVEQRRHQREEWLSKSIAEKMTQKEKEVLVKAISVLTKLVDLK